MKKKKIAIIAGVVVVAAAVTAGVWAYQTGRLFGKGKDNGDRVYVQSVADIMGAGTGVMERYSGVVEPQETWKLNVDEERTIKEVYVKEGDKVKEGTPLLEYDTEELQESIEDGKLELEGYDATINDKNQEIVDLGKQRDAATTDEGRADCTTQIQEAQMNIRETENDKKKKQAELDKLQEKIDNSVVKSKITGMVKSIQSSGSQNDGGDDSDAYMTIIATGKYRVKAICNEMNIGALSKGTDMILYSRTDESLNWTGKIKKIDMNNTVSSDNEYGGDDTNTASKYYFYITLDNSDGLMMGQHLYAEVNVGQLDAQEKEGIWLYSQYIVQKDGEKPYVWADNGDGELMKAEVKLGEYDENMDEYEIKSGLTEESLIACPSKNLYEGIKTVTDIEKANFSDDGMSDWGEAGDMGSFMSEDGDMGSYMPEDGEFEENSIDYDNTDDNAQDSEADTAGDGNYDDSTEDNTDNLDEFGDAPDYDTNTDADGTVG